MYLFLLQFFALILGALAVFFFAFDRLSRPKGFPPGPFIFPLVGSLPFLRRDPFGAIAKWHQRYGPVIGLYLGTYRTVFLTDAQLIRTTFAKQVAAGRPQVPYYQKISSTRTGAQNGITFNQGRGWGEQRTFVVSELKRFGFGSRSMEGMLVDDVKHLMTKLRPGVPLDLHRLLGLSVLRSLWFMATSVHYDLEDPELQKLSEMFATGLSKAGTAFFLPWLVRWFPSLARWAPFAEAIEGILPYVERQIAEHQEKLGPEDAARDLMDVFLHHAAKVNDADSSFYKEWGLANMRTSFFSIFGGGSETCGSLLNWSFVFIAQDSRIQQRLHEEIDTVVGATRIPSLADMERMPYTRALAAECLRLVSPLPYGNPHNTFDAMKIGDYDVPGDTVVIGCIYNVNNDPALWGDPERFRPERFLEPDAPQSIPFSSGKRICPGESLAHVNFFLHLVMLFQKYHFTLDPAYAHVSKGWAQRAGIIRYMPTYKVILTERHSED